MAEHLQGLLNKIQEEGLKKAETEKQTILAEAQAEAKKIVEQAKTEADTLRRQAESDAQSLQARAESAVRQAARDVILSLQTELTRRMNLVLEQRAGEGLTPEFMTELLKGIVLAYKADPANLNCDSATVLLNADKLAEMTRRVVSELASTFRIKAELFADRDIKGGFKVGFSGSDAYFDCTEAAIAELLATYLSPKLAALLTEEK